MYFPPYPFYYHVSKCHLTVFLWIDVKFRLNLPSDVVWSSLKFELYRKTSHPSFVLCRLFGACLLFPCSIYVFTSQIKENRPFCLPFRTFLTNPSVSNTTQMYCWRPKAWSFIRCHGQFRISGARAITMAKHYPCANFPSARGQQR